MSDLLIVTNLTAIFTDIGYIKSRECTGSSRAQSEVATTSNQSAEPTHVQAARAWARELGYNVPDCVRLPMRLVEQYEEAMRSQQEDDLGVVGQARADLRSIHSWRVSST